MPRQRNAGKGLMLDTNLPLILIKIKIMMMIMMMIMMIMMRMMIRIQMMFNVRLSPKKMQGLFTNHAFS